MEALTQPTLLYTRHNCPLCDEAHRILMEFGLRPQLIDIDQDVQWQERYTACVPVVWIDGKERFRGHVNRVLLKRLLLRRSNQARQRSNSREIREDPQP
ncbi:MAG: glutaredoxin family protein [Planctomycetota bacterium]|nr:glutaredoxin family protein [Planctomycetota bacterium]